MFYKEYKCNKIRFNYEMYESIYYGRNKSPYEEELEFWENMHPTALIRYEPLPGEVVLAEWKKEIEREEKARFTDGKIYN